MTSSDKIRVLIVDDIAETRENVRKLLQFESEVEVVGAARTGREAIDLAKDVSPDVVIMDINMPDMDGITATERIKRILPYAQIVILSVQSDPNYMRRAMMAGARDFLAKPPTVDELTSAIRRAGEMAHNERQKTVVTQGVQHGTGGIGLAGGSMGKVIMVYSPKGGTGCTTLATNLAVTLHNKETPAAIVDANLQFGDVAVFLNEQARNSVVDLAPRVGEMDAEFLDEVMVNHTASGIKILAAPSKPEYAEGVTGEQFGKIIRYMRRLFSYIVVDTCSTLTDSVLGVLDESDVIIVITTQDIPAIKNSGIFLDLIDTLKIPRQRILLVMNRFDKRIAITPERVSTNLKYEFAAVIPLEETTVTPSVNRGIPFMLRDKSRPVARGILTLAEAIRQRLSVLEAADDSVAVKRTGK
jgi:pilus assembly protein CpaE